MPLQILSPISLFFFCYFWKKRKEKQQLFLSIIFCVCVCVCRVRGWKEWKTAALDSFHQLTFDTFFPFGSFRVAQSSHSQPDCLEFCFSLFSFSELWFELGGGRINIYIHLCM
jgi:hypothetical protein